MRVSRISSTRRQRQGHTDDWLMTYADMITLLLCFFAIFLAITVHKKTLNGSTNTPPPVTAIQSAPKPTPVEYNYVIVPPVPLPVPEPEDAPQQTLKQAAPQPAVHDDAPVEAPFSLPHIIDDIKTEMPQETAAPEQPVVEQPVVEQPGDRITTMEISSATFFDSGSATLRDDGKEILRNVAAQLKAEMYKDYQITIEGHTDDTPITTAQFPSNWELSTSRAAAVVHFFLDQGLPAQKLRAAGYADSFPKAPNRNAYGIPIPENRAQNRRVVIKLEKIEKR